MRLPSFDFYPHDWLGDINVQSMTLEQQGAYIRLLAFQWQAPDCALPESPKELARNLGVSMHVFPKIWRHLSTGEHAVFFQETSSGKWRNPRLVREREKALRREKKAQEAASARWSKHAPSTSLPDAPGHACTDACSHASPMPPIHHPPLGKETKRKTRASARDVSRVLDEFNRAFVGVWKRAYRLTPKREAHIAARLGEFAFGDLAQAIVNLRASKWHCGENEHGRVYATPEFLFRSTEQVEQWLQQTGVAAPAPKSDTLNWAGVWPEDLAIYRDSGRYHLTQAQVDVLKTRVDGVDVIDETAWADEPAASS